jgi:hypothetical protein
MVWSSISYLIRRNVLGTVDIWLWGPLLPPYPTLARLMRVWEDDDGAEDDNVNVMMLSCVPRDNR